MNILEKRSRQHGDMRRHKQAVVCGKAFYNGFFQVYGRGLFIGAVERHNLGDSPRSIVHGYKITYNIFKRSNGNWFNGMIINYLTFSFNILLITVYC